MECEFCGSQSESEHRIQLVAHKVKRGEVEELDASFLCAVCQKSLSGQAFYYPTLFTRNEKNIFKMIAQSANAVLDAMEGTKNV